MKLAKPALTSETDTFETANAGVSFSLPPVPVPLSIIVPMPRLSAIVALVGLLKLTRKVSAPSKTGTPASLRIATVIVCVVTPGAKLSVPDVAEKSLPSTAVTELVL